MRKAEIYKRDWFIALLVGVVFGFAILARSNFLERLELIAYDIGVKVTHRTPGAADQIAIIAIDDPSIKEIGRWPWPRHVLAGVLERLAKAEARAVGVLVDLTEPQIDRGMVSIRDIRNQLDAMKVPKQARAPLRELRTLLDREEKRLDGDRLLAQAMSKAPRLHLPMIVEAGEPLNRPATKTPNDFERHRLAKLIGAPGNSDRPHTITRLGPPLDQFRTHAAGIGHLRFHVDPDNGVRAIYTVLEHGGAHYPSLSLLLAASALNLDARHIEFELGRGIKIGKRFVPTDHAARSYTGFYAPPPGQEHAFALYSLRDVYNDKLPPSVFTNKIVLIGAAAAGIGAKFATPLGTPMAEPELAANVIAGILNQDFYTRPLWVDWAEPGIALVVALYLMLAVPRMNGKTAALVSLLLLIGVLGAEQFLMVSDKVWLRTVSPALLLLVGHAAIGGKRLLLGEREHLEALTDLAHNNRLLGLAFQAQGQLDMAMDKFRKLPVDESVLDLIYNLALDFERKRQFHKAIAAYDYILGHQSGFRDCVERKKRAGQADQTGMVGTLVLDGTEKPALGRYLLEKELGRGAMGTVYLGRDPKINRLVAIKTLSLSADFEPKDLAGIRERFFSEAEAAGRLRHPNIVTIYDVGEEHDLAFIAMEYLEGKNLATHIQPDKPLPFDWIFDIAIKVADALAFAHRNDVVHRDIKPANIVYHEPTRGVKVTDFGIARITAAGRTKTGVVLGTPSYMSPEQISGKRVDGRSDLFSFGATLFEMVTGQTPFPGDSLAALTYQITNAPAPDVRKFRPDTPAGLTAIIRRLLHKQVQKRYQTGEDLRRELEQCHDTLAKSVKA